MYDYQEKYQNHLHRPLSPYHPLLPGRDFLGLASELALGYRGGSAHGRVSFMSRGSIFISPFWGFCERIERVKPASPRPVWVLPQTGLRV